MSGYYKCFDFWMSMTEKWNKFTSATRMILEITPQLVEDIKNECTIA